MPGASCRLATTEPLEASALLAMAAMLETMLYGLHFTLFFLCIFLFRKRRLSQWFILLPAIAMFSISSIDMWLAFNSITSMLRSITNLDVCNYFAAKLFRSKNTLFVASNCVAELTLLYRCYMVWGRLRYILICSAFVIADTAWGLVGMGPILITPHSNIFSLIYVWNLFAINILLTVLTVIRILLISNFSKEMVRRKTKFDAYHTAVAVLVETSAVYAACLLGFLLCPPSNKYKSLTVAIATRVVGLMPTLLIVQVCLGNIDVKSSATTISRFQVGTAQDPAVRDTLLANSVVRNTTLHTIDTSSDVMEEMDIALHTLHSSVASEQGRKLVSEPGYSERVLEVRGSVTC